MIVILITCLYWHDTSLMRRRKSVMWLKELLNELLIVFVYASTSIGTLDSQSGSILILAIFETKLGKESGSWPVFISFSVKQYFLPTTIHCKDQHKVLIKYKCFWTLIDIWLSDCNRIAKVIKSPIKTFSLAGIINY